MKLHKYLQHHGSSSPLTHRCQHQYWLVSDSSAIPGSSSLALSPNYKVSASVCHGGNVSGLTGYVPIRSFSCLSTQKSEQNRTSVTFIRSFDCLPASNSTQNRLKRHSKLSTLCPPISSNNFLDKRRLHMTLKCNNRPYLPDLISQPMLSNLTDAISLQRWLDPIRIFSRNYASFQNNHDDPANPNSQEFNNYLSYLRMEYKLITKRLETDEDLSDAERREMRKREIEMRFLVKQIGVLDQKKEELQELEMLAKGKVHKLLFRPVLDCPRVLYRPFT